MIRGYVNPGLVARLTFFYGREHTMCSVTVQTGFEREDQEAVLPSRDSLRGKLAFPGNFPVERDELSLEGRGAWFHDESSECSDLVFGAAGWRGAR